MIFGNYKIRAFLVTLQEMPEKEKFIRQHFQERGIECESFNGIHGETCGLRTIHTYERDNPGSGWRIGHKEVSTWLSFYTLWAALNLQPDSHFLTLEWDARFPENWRQRTEAALQNVPPDFDLLYLGSCCAQNGKPKRHVSGDVWDVRYPVCGHATIIAKKALPTMLYTQRKVYAPIDISLAFHSHPHLKVYTVLPRIVDQFNTFIPE